MCMLCLILSLDFKVLISKLNVCALFTMAIYVMLVELRELVMTSNQDICGVGHSLQLHPLMSK